MYCRVVPKQKSLCQTKQCCWDSSSAWSLMRSFSMKGLLRLSIIQHIISLCNDIAMLRSHISWLSTFGFIYLPIWSEMSVWVTLGIKNPQEILKWVACGYSRKQELQLNPMHVLEGKLRKVAERIRLCRSRISLLIKLTLLNQIKMGTGLHGLQLDMMLIKPCAVTFTKHHTLSTLPMGANRPR